MAQDDPKKVQAVIDSLWSAFDWSCTKQGHDYWREIVSKLESIRDKAKVTEKDRCREEIFALKAQIAELEKKCC